MHIRYLHAENLILDPWHPAGGSGAGVLRIAGTGRILDAIALRAEPDTKIITDDPEQVCKVLGIPFPDRQIIEG